MSFLHFSLGIVALALAAVETGWAAETGDNDARAHRFIEMYERVVRPLEIEVARSNWKANISGTEADFSKKEEAETRLGLQLADHKTFAELKAIHAQPTADPLLRRRSTSSI